MNWNAYVSRRNINVEQWLAVRGVKDRITFSKLLLELGLEMPDETQMSLMFPEIKPKKVEEVKNVSVTVSPERSDQVTTRSMVGEGDRTGERSDGKRSTKVRS